MEKQALDTAVRLERKKIGHTDSPIPTLPHGAALPPSPFSLISIVTGFSIPLVPVAAPAASFSATPRGLPSAGANMILNWSCTMNLNPTSGTNRNTLAPLPRYSACKGVGDMGQVGERVKGVCRRVAGGTEHALSCCRYAPPSLPSLRPSRPPPSLPFPPLSPPFPSSLPYPFPTPTPTSQPPSCSGIRRSASKRPLYC